MSIDQGDNIEVIGMRGGADRARRFSGRRGVVLQRLDESKAPWDIQVLFDDGREATVGWFSEHELRKLSLLELMAEAAQ